MRAVNGPFASVTGGVGPTEDRGISGFLENKQLPQALSSRATPKNIKANLEKLTSNSGPAVQDAARAVEEAIENGNLLNVIAEEFAKND